MITSFFVKCKRQLPIFVHLFCNLHKLDVYKRQATTFSLATPLLSMAISRVFGIQETNLLTIGILVIICVVYTMARCV